MIDKKLIEKRFTTNYKTYDLFAKVQNEVADELFTLIDKKDYEKILEVGCGTGFLTSKIAKLNPKELFINDLSKEAENYAKRTLKYHKNFTFLCGDAEKIEFPDNLDLITSASTIQWFENLNEFFKKSAKSLKSGGQLIFSTYIEGNFKEIDAVFKKSLKYYKSNEIAELAEKHFKIETYKTEKKILYFESLHDILKHIKYTGTNAFSGMILTKSLLAKSEEKYEHFRTPKGLSLTYLPAFFKFQKK